MSTASLLSLFLIFIRVLAVLSTAPIFGSHSVPTMVKIGFAALLSLVLLPVATEGGASLELPGHLIEMALLVAQEVLMGVLIGFASSIVFAAVRMAATFMGVQIGLQAANLFDPVTAQPSGALEQFYSLLATVLFLAIDGHHWLLLAVSETIRNTPLGIFLFDALTMERLLTMFSDTFVAALRISLPVVGALLLADIGLGLIARAVPQIQVFFLGLPLKMGLGFVVLLLTLVSTLPALESLFENVSTNIYLISTH